MLTVVRSPMYSRLQEEDGVRRRRQHCRQRGSYSRLHGCPEWPHGDCAGAGEFGADASNADNDGCTPVWTAAFDGHKETVRALVQECGTDAKTATNDGYTPLDVAAGRFNSSEMIWTLVEEAAEAAVFEELEAQGAEEPDPDKFTDPWDVSYNATDDYWYY